LSSWLKRRREARQLLAVPALPALTPSPAMAPGAPAWPEDAGNARKRTSTATPDLEKARAVAVQTVLDACRLTAEVQATLIGTDGVMSKEDKSPVTVADFASQALVSSALEEAFPEIPLVGEEDSSELRKDAELAAKVLRSVASVNPNLSQDDVYRSIDRGRHEGGRGLFWVLDPIDGTKGFLRREQYAVCLGLIQDGEVLLAVLGCPNLLVDPRHCRNSILRSDGASAPEALTLELPSDHHLAGLRGRYDLEAELYNGDVCWTRLREGVQERIWNYGGPSNVWCIASAGERKLMSPNHSGNLPHALKDCWRDTKTDCQVRELKITPSAAPRGCLFGAVRGQGAWQRDIATGEERLIRVSDVRSASEATLVESVDSGHSDHGLQARLGAALRSKAAERMDSQCKFGVVARGQASLYLRFAPKDQNIWDIAAGAMIVEEAGGRVTDAEGRPLNFAYGRTIGSCTIVASNGLLHEEVLTAIRSVRAS